MIESVARMILVFVALVFAVTVLSGVAWAIKELLRWLWERRKHDH